MIKNTVINNHEIKRNFGAVTIDGQKTPLRFGEAVRAVSLGQTTKAWKLVWDRQSQRWVTT